MRDLTLALAAIVAMCLAAPGAHAQSGIGVGVQLGEPTGVGVTWLGEGPGVAVDVLAAWDLGEDALFASGHVLFEQALSVNAASGGALRFVYGPGAFLTFDDADAASVGVSATAGLAYRVGAFDFYLRTTPRFSLFPGTEVGLGGGLGLRYFL